MKLKKRVLIASMMLLLSPALSEGKGGVGEKTVKQEKKEGGATSGGFARADKGGATSGGKPRMEEIARQDEERVKKIIANLPKTIDFRLPVMDRDGVRSHHLEDLRMMAEIRSKKMEAPTANSAGMERLRRSSKRFSSGLE